MNKDKNNEEIVIDSSDCRLKDNFYLFLKNEKLNELVGLKEYEARIKLYEYCFKIGFIYGQNDVTQQLSQKLRIQRNSKEFYNKQ